MVASPEAYTFAFCPTHRYCINGTMNKDLFFATESGSLPISQTDIGQAVSGLSTADKGVKKMTLRNKEYYVCWSRFDPAAPYWFYLAIVAAEELDQAALWDVVRA